MRNKRKIALDTETTGLRPGDHRIIEVGCVEIVNGSRTGSVFHAYTDPQRDMPEEAFKIHGISSEFLKGKPTFSKIAKEFLDYIGNSELVIHNAGFDIAFLNYELGLIGMTEIPMSRVEDTLYLARKKYPGSPASLDALCKRFGINLSSRQKHGALIDAELLALVYIELTGDTQSSLDLSHAQQAVRDAISKSRSSNRWPIRDFSLSDAERRLHEDNIARIKNPIWKKGQDV